MAITQGVVVPRTGAIWCAAVIGSTGDASGLCPSALSSSCSGAPYRWRAFPSGLLHGMALVRLVLPPPGWRSWVYGVCGLVVAVGVGLGSGCGCCRYCGGWVGREAAAP